MSETIWNQTLGGMIQQPLWWLKGCMWGCWLLQTQPNQSSLETKMNQLVSAQSDFMTNMSAMMNKFVSSIVPKRQEEEPTPQKKLYNPYPENSRYGQQFINAGSENDCKETMDRVIKLWTRGILQETALIATALI